MKTSKKILLTFTGILLALLICGMMLLRSDLEALPLSGYQYQTATNEPFNTLRIDGNWSVKIRQRSQHEVEVEGDAKEILKTLLKIENGILNIKNHASSDSTRTIHLRISTPMISKIHASNKTEISMTGFESDSLQVRLEKGSSFISSENILEKTTIETSGHSWIQLIDDPMK